MNQSIYKGTPIEFVSKEVSEWITLNDNTGTLFLTAGTLECFTQKELEEFLALVKASYAQAAIALLEPVSFDLATHTESTPRVLYMFNHNYPYLLEKAGYSVYALKSAAIETYDGNRHHQSLSIIAYLN